MKKYSYLTIVTIFFLTSAFTSCSSRMGYGVLLWSIEDPPILSGTVLPVYIRSNITQTWVIGVPAHLVQENGMAKMEVPLARLEFIGNRNRALTWAQEFAEYAHIYAENLQDGLPIRSRPDNNSQRVYRLRVGQVVKVLGTARGVPPISAAGDPLPGEWLKVLTNEGVTGYCFSFRLRLFDQNDAALQTTAFHSHEEVIRDPELETILSRTWSPDFYMQMVNSGRINIPLLERRFHFDPGHETGIARIVLPDLERTFHFDRIVPDGDRAWRFGGTSLHMILRGSNSLAVQFTEDSGSRRTLHFSSLGQDVGRIIQQEIARRNELFMEIFNAGPSFTSAAFGTITFISTGNFTWTGFENRLSHLFPTETNGQGRINMDIFLTPSLEEQYDGAFTLQFTDVRTNNTFYFMYTLTNDGLRLELVPAFAIENVTVSRRAADPMVMFFFRDS